MTLADTDRARDLLLGGSGMSVRRTAPTLEDVRGLYSGMKMAISVPDDLFEAAEDLAKELGVSRSQLYARAVAEYIAQHRDDELTAKLNEAYA